MWKVPNWAIPQHRTHANPPTFLLVIELLLGNESNKVDGVSDDDRWLAAVYPALIRWYEWFQRSQAGSVEHAFRWRGRDPTDGKLNPMTLSSGLDDYPRVRFPVFLCILGAIFFLVWVIHNTGALAGSTLAI